MNLRQLCWQALDVPKQLAKQVEAKLKPLYCPLQQRNNHGLYAVDICAKVGFFAQINWCLYIFAHCERYGLKPYIVLSSPFYTDSRGGNWFDYFFENIALSAEDKKNIADGLIKISKIADLEQLGLPSGHESDIGIESASRLIGKCMKIKSDIQDYVDSFSAKHFATNKKILGVHYRGTDKKSEAEPVSRDYCFRTIHNFLNSNPQIDALFASSDEESFVESVGKEFRFIEVISHEDTCRSKDGKAVHAWPKIGDNYLKGKEALVNCLLLSRCEALIRTASFLSAWSSVFNPGLPVVMLNKPYDDTYWFPDSEIVERSLNEYLPSRM